MTTDRARAPAGAVVVPLTRRVDDAELVRALLARAPWAGDELVRRYGTDVRRVLARILGGTSELPDLVHESMVRALSGLGELRKAEMLRSWLVGIAVRVAREHLRAKRKRPTSMPMEELPQASVEVDPDARRALARTFEILAQLPDEERIAFALRFIDGMKLEEVAASMDVSLATAKRRIARAEGIFVRRASSDPVLGPRLGAGRWTTR